MSKVQPAIAETHQRDFIAILARAKDFNNLKRRRKFLKSNTQITKEMFTHHGKTRTIKQNKKIATLLSFVAGIVNVAGFLAVKKLTTNVTGHFAFFIDDVFKLNFNDSFIYFFYILSFFLGSFCSSLMVELVAKKNERYIYIVPTVIESIILFSVAIFSQTLLAGNFNVIAVTLLFAMGLQNSLVTRISDAVVRTTHVTGLFTDLGIELSQLFFHTTKKQHRNLTSTIRLRLRIIITFFAGGIFGGIFYTYLALYVLIIPATLLLIGLFYDSAKYRLLNWKRSYTKKERIGQ